MTPSAHTAHSGQVLADADTALTKRHCGKAWRAKAGPVNVLGGAPFGYRYIRKTPECGARYETIDHEAALVAEMFRRYADDGATIADLARWLTSEGVPTRTGTSRWERSVIWGMLRNPAYAGRAVFGKTQVLHEQPGLNRVARLAGRQTPRPVKTIDRPREEWTEIAVPAIVSEDTFERVQARLADNKRFAPRNSKLPPSLLQGMAACTACGYAYYRTSTRTTAKKIYYYRCLGSDNYRYQGGRVCANPSVRADYLDAVVWDHITALLADPALIRAEISKRLEQARTSDPALRQRKRLETALAKATKSITAMIEAYSEQLITIDEMRSRMPQLRAREASLRAQLEAAQAQAADRDAYLKLAGDLEGFLAQLRSTTATASTGERRRVLKLLVKDVLIGPEKITIRHRIPARASATAVTQRDPQPDTEGDHRAGCQVRWGRGRATLRGPGHLTPHLPVLHHPGAQHRAHELQDGLVADALLNRLHQLVTRDRRKAIGDVRLDHPPPALPGLIHEDLQGIVRRPPRAEPETARQEVRLEDRLEHDLAGGLHDPVTDRGDRQRPALAAARLRDEHPSRGQRTPHALPQIAGQLAEQPGHPVLLDISQGDLVNARRAVVPAHRNPRPPQDVLAVNLVPQRMEPSFRVGLGRPVKHMLQSANPVPVDNRQGGPSRILGTHRSGPPSLRVNEAAALPSPQVVLSCGSTSTTAASDSLPAPRPLPGSSPVIGQRWSTGTASPLRPGRASPVPAATF